MAEPDYKTCSKCKERKSREEFYRDGRATDGLASACKRCHRAQISAWQRANPERQRAYDKARAARLLNSPGWHERRAIADKRSAERNRKRKAEAAKRYYENNQEKAHARIALGNAIRDGKVLKPEHCSRCDTETSSRHLHGHHEDYGKPFEVDWLCRACHLAEHGKKLRLPHALQA